MTGLSRGREERGAVAPFVAISMVLLVAIAAFVVDLGMQRVLRRDMQALADVVALDLSRQIPGKNRSDLDVLAPAVIATTLANNKDTLGDGENSSADDPDVSAEFGTIAPTANGSATFTVGGLDSFPNAVRVTAHNSIGFALTPGGGGATRTAIAAVEGGACFAIGSYAANLDTGESPILGPLLGALGSNVALSVADYNALAAADVDLLNLLGVHVGAGTLQELIDGGELVQVGDFYAATATVLQSQGGNIAAVTALQALSLAVGPLNLQIPAGDLLSIGTGGASGLDAALNVLDLVTAAAAIATGEYGVVIPQASVNLGPVANVQSSLHVIEAPRQGCGRANEVGAEAANSSVSLDLSTSLADITVPDLLRTSVDLSGSIDVASAKGQLTDVRCNPPGITVAVADGLLEVDLRLEVTVYARVGLVTIPVVSGPITITGHSTSTGEAVINIAADGDYEIPAHVTNSSSGLPVLSVNTSGLELIGLPVGVLLAPIINSLVSGLVNPLVASLDDVLLTPLLDSLGMDISGADVFAVRTPKCDASTLRG